MDLHEISVQLQAGKAKIVKTLVQQAIDNRETVWITPGELIRQK